MNSSGKILSVFLIIIVILLISLTAISIFIFQKESERRKVAERDLEKAETAIARFEQDVASLKEANTVLEEKNKEADERINSLMDDMELNEALREEIKNENITLKQSLQTKEEEVKQIEADLKKKIETLNQEIADLKEKYSGVQSQETEWKEKLKQYEQENQKLKTQLNNLQSGQSPSGLQSSAGQVPPEKQKVELDKIVVMPDMIPEGRILSVDQDTDFVIINLGEKAGLKLGHILAVYHGNEYLGDIKVTRLQPEMSAADLMPPLSSKIIHKNDQVVVKP